VERKASRSSNLQMSSLHWLAPHESKMIITSNTCQCGHMFHKHSPNGECNTLVIVYTNWYTSCICRKYRLNNLDYLESLYEKKHS
jgi:hypothetical protein